MTSKTNRRIAKPKTDKELYQSKQIKKFISSERRKEELNRLFETKRQGRTWNITMFICLTLNLALIGLAISGMYK